MILHLKSPNVIGTNQQSDLLMCSSGLFQRHIVSYIEMEGTPPVTSTQLNIQKKKKKQVVFLSASSFAPKWSNFVYLFRRIDALLQGFLVLLRSILSEPGDEKTCLRGFWPVKIQSVCSATGVS